MDDINARRGENPKAFYQKARTSFNDFASSGSRIDGEEIQAGS